MTHGLCVLETVQMLYVLTPDDGFYTPAPAIPRLMNERNRSHLSTFRLDRCLFCLGLPFPSPNAESCASYRVVVTF